MKRNFLPKLSSVCLCICLFMLMTSSCAKKRVQVSENAKPLIPTSIHSAGPQQKEDTKQDKDGSACETAGHQRNGNPLQLPDEEFEQCVSHAILFEFDRSDLNLDARNVLKKAADLLRRRPVYCLRIDGHCDERGTLAYNLALGEMRAQAAKAFLMSLGIAGNRIATFSYGEERPEDPRHVPQAWARNRRDILTFIQ